MQRPGGVRLGRKDALDLLGAKRVDRGVIEHPGGVDDRTQGMGLGDRVHQRLELGGVGDVTSDDLCLGAQLLELRPELLRPLCLVTTATDQEQITGAVD